MKVIVIPKGTRLTIYGHDGVSVDGILSEATIYPLSQIINVHSESIRVNEIFCIYKYEVCYWECSLVDMDSMAQVRQALEGGR
jgi:hypothetical protein